MSHFVSHFASLGCGGAPPALVRSDGSRMHAPQGMMVCMPVAQWCQGPSALLRRPAEQMFTKISVVEQLVDLIKTKFGIVKTIDGENQLVTKEEVWAKGCRAIARPRLHRW